MKGPIEPVSSLYARHAEAWARQRGEKLHEGAWLDRFLNYVPDGGSVLDLGCGPGVPIAQELAARGYRVTGVDAAAPMVELFSTALPSHSAIVADMRSVKLADSFDGVLAWNSFFHLAPDDQRAMFPAFARWARPGAPLMFTAGPAAGEAIGELEGEPLYHASLDPDDYRELLATNGFEALSYQPEDPDCGGLTVWLARRI